MAKKDQQKGRPLVNLTADPVTTKKVTNTVPKAAGKATTPPAPVSKKK